jgi:hypothetical protein
MNAHVFARVAASLAAGLTAACQSQRTARIDEKSALFATLPVEIQSIIKDGLVDVGFTPDLVYMALGKPNRVQSGEAVEGTMTTWTYKNFVMSSTVAMKLGMNNPGARYQGGRLVSPNAPGGASIASTRNVGPQPTVSDMGDATVGTLYVEFLNDRVFSIRLER